VGEENQGWSIAKRLLEFERSGVYGPRTRRILARTERIARTDGAAWASYAFRRRFAEASIALDALEAAELRLLSEPRAGDSGVSTSILKLAGTEVMQRTTELALWASGTDACYRVIDHEGGVRGNEGAISMARYLNARAATIYGGSSEVQRNILARTALGL
jgi:acyl-CoA dehydrogenase